jgi:hypothetical protein
VMKHEPVMPGASALSHPGREKFARLRSEGIKGSKGTKTNAGLVKARFQRLR